MGFVISHKTHVTNSINRTAGVEWSAYNRVIYKAALNYTKFGLLRSTHQSAINNRTASKSGRVSYKVSGYIANTTTITNRTAKICCGISYKIPGDIANTTIITNRTNRRSGISYKVSGYITNTTTIINRTDIAAFNTIIYKISSYIANTTQIINRTAIAAFNTITYKVSSNIVNTTQIINRTAIADFNTITYKISGYITYFAGICIINRTTCATIKIHSGVITSCSITNKVTCDISYSTTVIYRTTKCVLHIPRN